MVSQFIDVSKKNPSFDWVEGLSKALKNVDGFKNVTKESIDRALKNIDLDNIDEVTGAIAKLGTEGSSGLTKFGNALKTVGKSALGLLTNPITWGIIAAGVTAAAVSFLAYNNSLEAYADKAEAAKTALSETTSELDSLESQLASNKTKLDELNSDEISTAAHADEIAALQRENALLETQIELKKQSQTEQKSEVSDTSKDALTKQYHYNSGFYYSDANGNETGYWNEGEWQQSYFGYGNIVDQTKSQIAELASLQEQYDTISDKNSETYIEDAENREAALRTLQDRMTDLESQILQNKTSISDWYGGLFDGGKLIDEANASIAEDIETAFPEFVGGLNENMQAISDAYKQSLIDIQGENFDQSLLDSMNDWLGKLNDGEQEIVYDLYFNSDNAIESLSDLQNAYENYKLEMSGSSDSLSIDLDEERTGIESVTSAINESASATGLASETIKTLKERYADLDGFDAATLFENTATGIKLNSRELARLERQYEATNKQKIADRLVELSDEYESLTEKIEQYKDTAMADDYRARRDAIEDEIESTKALAAEYNGLTSAYAEWVNAQSTTQAGAWYDSAKDGLDSLKELYKSGDFGNTALLEGLEYFTGKNITGIDDYHERIQAIHDAYAQLDTKIAGTSYSINDFMAGGQDGCNN